MIRQVTKSYAGRLSSTCAALALSGMLTLTAPLAAMAQQNAYRVTPGDTLQVTVYGDAGLTGQFPVSADGAISYPLLGNFPVANMTMADIETAINSALAQHVAGRSAAVSVNSYAPIFVLGEVEKPGKYDYRPGMIALELVAIGGGIRKSKGEIDSAGLQMVSARQEYADLSLQVFSNDIKHARLKAELDSTGFSYALGNDLEPAERQIRQKIVDSEATLFEIRRNTLRQQSEALEGQRKSFLDEIAALEGRIELHNDELKLMTKDVEAVGKLVDRGLTAQSNLRDVQRALSVARRDSLEMESYLARARQGSLDLEQRIVALTETVRNDAASVIREIEIDQARKDKQMTSILNRMAEIGIASENLKLKEKRVGVAYSLTRMIDGNYQEVPATQETSLKPGDILRAEMAMPNERSASVN
ncbi:polysaccharide biosynthesis/export family protein [Mesorhizobium sp. SB112]|uniref:polysaccharide biosynthesis/export family protein n=1 Tax=Mesorhizobium sp. SB112 TaxID=3151853 RepID=UPI003266D765